MKHCITTHVAIMMLCCLVAVSLSVPVLAIAEKHTTFFANNIYTEDTYSNDLCTSYPDEESVSQEDNSSQMSDSKTENAESILTIPIGKDGNSVTYEICDAGNEGPEDFIVMNDNDVLILDRWSNRILRYKDGKYSDTISLDYCFMPTRMVHNNGSIYVLDRYSVSKIDINSGDHMQFMLPQSDSSLDFSMYVCDIIIRSDTLVLVTEKYGNYSLDNSSGKFVKTRLGYSISREGDYVIVSENNTTYKLHAPDVAIQVIDFGADGGLFVSAFDFKIDRDDPNYCTIRKYSKESALELSSPVDTLQWNNIPVAFAKIDSNQNAYIFSPYNTHAAVSKLVVGEGRVFDD